MESNNGFPICEFFLTKKDVLENEKVFIDKPVIEVMEKIDKSRKSKIILSGTEDSGKKLTTLKYMDTRDKIFVYFRIDEFKYYGLAKTKDKIEAYIESIVASEILKLLSRLGLDSQMLELGTNMPYIQDNIDVLRNYKAGDLISTLLYRVRKITDRKIVFVVDKMDILDKYTQEVISKYFDIFDQSLIISNDLIVYQNLERRVNLIRKGFDIINVDYAKNPEVLIQIINSRITYHNENVDSRYKLDSFENMLDYDVIEKIADLSKGNIRNILCVAKLVYSKCNIELHDTHAVGNYVISALDRLNKGRCLTLSKNLYL